MHGLKVTKVFPPFNEIGGSVNCNTRQQTIIHKKEKVTNWSEEETIVGNYSIMHKHHKDDFSLELKV